MKILYTTDLHGKQQKYEKLIEASRASFDLVINGGDMLPNDGDLYSQREFIENELPKHFEQFERAEIHYLCCLGNDDLKIFNNVFDEVCSRFSYIHNLAQRRHKVLGYEFIGMNWVVDYPFPLKDRCRKDTKDYVFQAQLGTAVVSTPSGWFHINDWPAYANTLPTIEQELKQLPRPQDKRKAIYVVHMPPARLGLDVCRSGETVGSQAIYDFLLKKQPMLALHGHIHESSEVSGKWMAQLGTTICIQPGQPLDKLSYVEIEISSEEEMKFRLMMR